MNQKIGIVDVGGGYRGVYAAGVMDRLMQMDLWFDLGIGVSAGSANLASYCARQPRRNLKFYTEYGLRKEYAGIGNYLRSRSYIDLSYIYGTLTNSDGEYPLNFDSMMANPMDTLTVITNAQTGEPRYVRKEELIRDQYIPFMASSAIPGICRPVLYEGVPFYDGALGDPVPIRKAFNLGCDKVVLILTLPEDTIRSPAKDARLARRIRREYPAAAEAMAARAEKYNEGVALARQFAAEGKLLILAPDDTCGVHTLCRDARAMKQLYAKGFADAEKIVPFLFG